MDVREKLVELLEEFFGSNYPEFVLESIADHLIAHGVTVQEQGRWVNHNFWGQEQWVCSERQTLGSPQWKCCPVCEAKMDGGNADGICKKN